MKLTRALLQVRAIPSRLYFKPSTRHSAVFSHWLRIARHHASIAKGQELHYQECARHHTRACDGGLSDLERPRPVARERG